MRRRQRRLRQWLRHERLSVAMAFAENSHHAAPRGQTKARAGGGARDVLHGGVSEDALPQAAGAQFFSLGDDDVEPPAAVRRTFGRGAAADGVQAALWQRLRACSRCHSAAAWERTGGCAKRRVSGRRAERSHSSSWWWAFQNSSWRSSRFTPRTGPTFQFFSPAPAVSLSPAPVVEYISHAPAVSQPPAPVEEYISHTPAVFPATAPVVEYFSPVPAVFPATAPVVEYFSPAPAVFPVTAPVVEYFSPVPAVFPAAAPVVEYFSPAPAVPQASSSAVAGGDSQGSVPGQSSAVRGRAVARGRRPQGPMPPLVAELFALGELPPEARTPRKRARMREIVAWLDGEG